MKNSFHAIGKSLSFTFLISLIFFQCEKSESSNTSIDASLTNLTTTSNISLLIKASDFIKVFENEANISGIFITKTKGVLLFEKAVTNNNKFIKEAIKTQPNSTLVIINELGKIESLDAQKASQEGFPGSFELIHFNWKDIEMIARNSDKLYFTQARIENGSTIHNTNTTDQLLKKFDTIKVEGDFSLSTNINNKTTPKAILGLPCPPRW